MNHDIPVRVGETYEVEAVRLNDDGDGVAAVEGFTVFVPGLLPGERAKVTVQDVEKRFARGIVTGELERVAPTREAPRCRVFGDCGGCQLQHLSYDAQLQHKRDMVEQALKRLARLSDVPVLPTLGMSHPWRYRNQVQVPLAYDERKQRLVQGFFAVGSHRVVETDVCHLASTSMEETIRRVVGILQCDLGSKAADAHHIVLRESRTTGEQLVVLCTRSGTVIDRDIAERIAELPRVVGVAQTVQPRPHGPIWGRTVESLAGSSHLTETIEGVEFLISARSFFQVNTSQAAKLYEKAVEFAQVKSGDVVLDAYCGTGTLTLLFARHAGRALGIELVPEAIADARRNADHNGIANAEFVVGEVERVLPKRVQQGEHYDVAVVDPPRRGCHPNVLRALAEAKPRRIVYVSCNHATFARDARTLTDLGYHLEKVQPVDMFPQTSHVECVAALSRVD
jgi:23S rRNA (uracil1939-C5)-methyltransferase